MKNYYLHSVKLEFSVLKWAICERFRDYLFHASSFVVYTDNNPLTYVLTSTKLNATGHRWVAELADYNFTIRYHPEKNNTDADILSCMPVDIESYMEKCIEEVPQGVISVSMEGVAVERESPRQGGVVHISALDLVKDSSSRNPGQSFMPAQICKAQEEDNVIGRALWYKQENK